MTVSNKELLEKAAITAANDLAASGKLNPQQADKFIDFVFDETVLNKFARTVKFRNESLDIDKIGIGSRAAVPKAEAVDPGVRRGVNTSKVTLTPVEVMVPLEISDNFKELNIEGDSVVEHILRIYARRLANDWEELNIHGNTAGYLVPEDVLVPGGSGVKVLVDSYLSLFDGWLKLAEGGNLVDHAGGVLSASLFRKMLSAMPSKFKRNKRDLKWLMPVELEELWRERVATRATGMGDMALSSQGNLTPFGIEILPVPLMDFNPQQVQVAQFSGAGATITLNHAPILSGSVVIIDEADAGGAAAIDPYTETTDFTVDEAAGTITHVGGGSIPTTTDLRISYRSNPEILLTTRNNLIMGIGRDIRMEKDRDIFRSVDQFATTVKFACEIEELTAIVKAKNIADAL